MGVTGSPTQKIGWAGFVPFFLKGAAGLAADLQTVLDRVEALVQVLSLANAGSCTIVRRPPLPRFRRWAKPKEALHGISFEVKCGRK